METTRKNTSGLTGPLAEPSHISFPGSVECKGAYIHYIILSYYIIGYYSIELEWYISLSRSFVCPLGDFLGGASEVLSAASSFRTASPQDYSVLRIFNFCSYKAQENIKNISFVMVLRGV